MSSKSEETRAKILEAVITQMTGNLGKGVRMNDIAKTAGVSRQAVYLHFKTRAELLEATTRYMDEKLNINQRLAPSRAAKSGEERLDLYIEAWGNYIPHIYPVGKALMSMLDTDEDAAAAWEDRMAAMREGCRAAIERLASEQKLLPEWTVPAAIDALWVMLTVPNWERLTHDCSWSNDAYVQKMQFMARRCFVVDRES